MTLTVPELRLAKINDLRPTQITIGFREVEQKRKEWRERVDIDGAKFLSRHAIPVVLRKDTLFIVDHHHLAKALVDEGVEEVLYNTVADLRKVDKDSFWNVMDIHNWCHPYDKNGDRVHFSEIPSSVTKLEDDPFRSLSGALRRSGGFAKDISNYSEFLWADFLRRRIKKKLVIEDFEASLKEANALAKSKESHYLPGWSGPS